MTNSVVAKMAPAESDSVLDYLEVLLTAPVLFSIVAILFILFFKEDIKALLLRIAKIKLPGGTEVSTPQSERSTEEKNTDDDPPIVNSTPITGLPNDLTPQQQREIEQIIRAHISTAFLWEYRYLNYFLVRRTQDVLDWFINLGQDTSYSYFDSAWIPFIPAANERQAIFNALESHHLIQYNQQTGMIQVTPKGREYQNWRGVLPALTNA
jgi:hypothetical protein